jgi:hypothetical protein
LPPNQALPEGIPLGQADGMSVVQNSLLWWVFVFIIQFLVPITMILINLVISMNSFRFVYIETYQRRIPIYREPVR